MDIVQQQRDELKSAIENIQNLYKELENEKKRFEALMEEMKKYDAPDTVVQSANEIYDVVNSKAPKAPEPPVPSSEKKEETEVIPFEKAPRLGEEKDAVSNEELSKEEAKKKLVTMKLSNNLAQRTISLVKAGVVEAWDKLASHFEQIKTIQYKNEINERKLQITKSTQQKEKYEQKMRPILEKRFAKHNKWRQRHHMEPLPPEEMYKVYKQRELVHLDTLDSVIEGNIRLYNIYSKELEKIEEKAQERKQYINTHKNIASNKYVIDKKQNILVQGEEQAEKQFNRPEQHIRPETESQSSKELNERLNILLTSPSNSLQYKAIVAEYKEKNEKTGKQYPAKGIGNQLVAMSYVAAQKGDYPDLHALDYKEAIEDMFPSLSEQERNDIGDAISNPEAFISKANENNKDMDYKNKILLAAIQIEPKASTLALAVGIKENMLHGEKPYQAIAAFAKGSVMQTKGAILENIPPQMVKALDNQINIERTLNALKKEEKQEIASEKELKQPVSQTTSRKEEKAEEAAQEKKSKSEPKHEKEPEIIPPQEPEEPEVTEADAERLMRMFNEGYTVSKEEKWDVFQEAKEEAKRQTKEAKANKDFNLIDEKLKDGACLDFTVGGFELRAERSKENGELIIGQYDYEEKRYVPMEKRDIINTFMDHPKDVTDTIAKNLSDSREKETSKAKESEQNLS